MTKVPWYIGTHEAAGQDGPAARGELPDAAVSESGLKITPLTNTVPEEASALMRRAYALLPHIKITDYTWQAAGRLRKGSFKHLRPFTASNE